MHKGAKASLKVSESRTRSKKARQSTGFACGWRERLPSRFPRLQANNISLVSSASKEATWLPLQVGR